MTKPHKTLFIFSDAATSSQTMVSIGAFLCLDQSLIEVYSKTPIEKLSSLLANKVIYKKYNSKKSTWSEIKTVIDALFFLLEKFGPSHQVELYTDCKSLCDLLGRRKEKLTKANFITRSGKIHPNADLYKELFKIADQFQIKTFKIKGHAASKERLTLHEKIFAMLDKLTREKLRSVLTNFNA